MNSARQLSIQNHNNISKIVERIEALNNEIRANREAINTMAIFLQKAGLINE